MRTRISPLAGKRLAPSRLVDVGKLVTAYSTGIPDPALPAQRVAFGTGSIARAMPAPKACGAGPT